MLPVCESVFWGGVGLAEFSAFSTAWNSSSISDPLSIPLTYLRRLLAALACQRSSIQNSTGGRLGKKPPSGSQGGRLNGQSF